MQAIQPERAAIPEPAGHWSIRFAGPQDASWHERASLCKKRGASKSPLEWRVQCKKQAIHDPVTANFNVTAGATDAGTPVN